MAFARGVENDRGAAAIIFALALVPILALIGAGLDYSRASAVRTRLQTALDSAVLAAAVTPGTPDERRATFKQTFDSHFFGAEAVTSAASMEVTAAGLVTGRASATVTTTVAKVIGISTLDLAATSDGRIPGSFEIMMVLDVSGSMKWADMSGRARIDVLKEAAAKLVDSAIAEAPAASRPKFGYVPFTMNVNIGKANAAHVEGVTDPLFTGTTWAGCVMERAPPNHLSINYSPTAKFRAYIHPPETDSNNCVNPSNGTNTGYAVVEETHPWLGALSGYTRGPNYNCVRHPVAPLTTDVAAIKAKIASLTSEWNMGTILAPGVTWGMRLLTPNAPFPGAAAHGAGTKKVMVMLTDGAQTTEMRTAACFGSPNASATPYRFDPAKLDLAGRVMGPKGPRDYFGPYGYIYDSDPFNVNFKNYGEVDASLDPLAIEACDAAKALGIEIYSVAVSASAGPGTRVHETLRNCASGPSHFFYATDAAALNQSFVMIGRNAARFVRTR